MKVKNKKTGEIGTLIVDGAYNFVTNFAVEDDERNRLGEYCSLSELNAECEDYEEPESGIESIRLNDMISGRHIVEIDFTKVEEAEKAVEKLKAWTRLKDKGFRFEYCDCIDGEEETLQILAHLPEDVEPADYMLLFGGEK